ncbi:MAG: hypothetical protein QT08_C0019G0019 [archaeon GW2011_AR17]|nr:MAG: hypothetical protein QT08_C0019G0019 [archaeon GW2011_AR17]MBS3154721.1 hypothetical protein [Candidatus Woesearchaeota archaeon]HIH15752.1 hypothetical protein [Nanoarchaeota archaeon]HIH58436.1 hypothetical protein [Nanoarchaeota archaeon]HII13714.1 hypothetical protein [Nanoarchaeota archaeon]
MNKDEALEQLTSYFKDIAERQKGEQEQRRTTALAAIPENISKIYLHVGSDRVDCEFRSLIRERFAGRILQTRINYWGQLVDHSFEDIRTYLSGVDALVFLGYYLCDNTQGSFSIWNMMRLAETVAKPLYVGYSDSFCFQSHCPEIEPLQKMGARLFQTF